METKDVNTPVEPEGSVKEDVTTICGYLVKFGEADLDGNIFMPGAFSKQIEQIKAGEELSVIVHVGPYKLSVPLTHLSEDETGVYYEADWERALAHLPKGEAGGEGEVSA